MGVFTRPDSPWWWCWLETAPPGQQKRKTAVRVGKTVTERRDSRLQAEAVYRKHMDALAALIHALPVQRDLITFTAAADRYARDVVVHHKGATREREILKGLKAAFGEELLHTIDRARVQRWMATRIAQVSAATVNRELDVLKQLLRDAVPKYLPASPIAGLKRLKAPTPQRRLLSVADERALLQAATDPQDRALLIVGMDTLIRLGDLLDLRRTDRRGAWLYVRDPKNGQAYEVPLSPRAAKALAAIPGDDPYFFSRFRRAKNPRDWRGAVRQRLEQLCKRAGVKFGKAEGGITFHWATRRTGATRLLVAKRQPVPVVQRLGNWRHPDVLLQIYAEADREDLLVAVGAKRPRSATGSGSGVTGGESRRKPARDDEGAPSGSRRTRLKSSK